VLKQGSEVLLLPKQPDNIEMSWMLQIKSGAVNRFWLSPAAARFSRLGQTARDRLHLCPIGGRHGCRST
jgi:hypothetical protein